MFLRMAIETEHFNSELVAKKGGIGSGWPNASCQQGIEIEKPPQSELTVLVP
jgi:hypothetical protein